MTRPDSWLELKDWFTRALDLGIEDREALLEEVRNKAPEIRDELIGLLDAHDRAANFLEESPLGERVERSAAGAGRIARIGPYSLEVVVGVGGMSTVYEAVHESTQRAVCVKIMRLGFPGVDRGWSRRRFQREAKVLGRLEHPNIARVYDAGTYELNGESVPYFVLERVRSARDIVEYCAESRLSITDRLRLFAVVCDAIHHGHLNGIIHRDIKPGNILVDEAALVKVIDFGVARVLDEGADATEHRTGTGIVLGTLRYMSPEQVASAGDHVDARSDVYSLGVVLYELLTGALPYDLEGLSIYQMADAIRTSAPNLPSRVSRFLKGDIESIVLRTLAKEREARYDSAAALRDDILRYLANEPIQARPPSALYHLRKLVSRHKATTSLTAAVVFLSITFGIAMSFQSADLREQRDVAGREAELARAAHDVLLSFVSAASPFKPRFGAVEMIDSAEKDLTLRELVEREGDRVVDALADQPVLQAELLSAFGAVFADHARFERAADYLERAIDIKKREQGEDHETTLKSMEYLASVESARGRTNEARKIVERALSMVRESPRHGERSELPFLRALARMEERDQTLAEAKRHVTRALDIAGRADVPEDEESWLWHDLGRFELAADRSADAETALLRSLELMNKTYGPRHLNTSMVLSQLARLAIEQEKLDRALDYANRTLDIRRERLDADHPFVIESLRLVGSICSKNGEAERADELLTEAMRRSSERGVDESTMEIKIQLGEVNHMLDRNDEAEKLLREAMDAYDRNPEWGNTYRLLGAGALAVVLLFKQEDLDTAKRLLLMVNENARSNSKYRTLSINLLNLAHVYALQGKLEEAAAHLRESFEVRGEHVGQFGIRPYIDGVIITLQYAFQHRELFERVRVSPHAVDAFAAAADHWNRRDDLPGRVQKYLAFLNRVAAEAFVDEGRYEDAVPKFRIALQIYRTVYPAGDFPHVCGTEARLGYALWKSGSSDEAEKLLQSAHRGLTLTWGARHPFTTECTRFLASYYDELGESEKARPYHELLKPEESNHEASK